MREVPAEARRFVDSHGTGVTGGFELLDMSARNRTPLFPELNEVLPLSQTGT